MSNKLKTMINYISFIITNKLNIIVYISSSLVYWFAIPFRKYGRNIVYNYAIQNNIYINGFSCNKFEYTDTNYEKLYLIINPKNNINTGYIVYKKVNKLEYLFAKWFIWIWLDDKADMDLFDTSDLIYMKNKKSLNKYYYEYIAMRKNSYNSFQLGDKQFDYNYFLPALVHFFRMKECNFEYMYNYTTDSNKTFKNKYFGWKTYIDINSSKQVYKKYIKNKKRS